VLWQVARSSSPKNHLSLEKLCPVHRGLRDERAEGPGLALRLKSWTAVAPALG
jgi:hypothetical protein